MAREDVEADVEVVFVSLGDASVDGAELGVHGGHGEPVGKEERRGKWSRASGDGEQVRWWGVSLAEGGRGRGPGRGRRTRATARHGVRVSSGRRETSTFCKEPP